MSVPCENLFKRQVALSTDRYARENHVRRGSALSTNLHKNFSKNSENLFDGREKNLVDVMVRFWQIYIGRCSSCDLEHRQMNDGWG